MRFRGGPRAGQQGVRLERGNGHEHRRDRRAVAKAEKERGAYAVSFWVWTVGFACAVYLSSTARENPIGDGGALLLIMVFWSLQGYLFSRQMVRVYRLLQSVAESRDGVGSGQRG